MTTTTYCELTNLTPNRATVLRVLHPSEAPTSSVGCIYAPVECDSDPVVGERVYIRRGQDCIYPSAVTGRGPWVDMAVAGGPQVPSFDR